MHGMCAGYVRRVCAQGMRSSMRSSMHTATHTATHAATHTATHTATHSSMRSRRTGKREKQEVYPRKTPRYQMLPPVEACRRVARVL